MYVYIYTESIYKPELYGDRGRNDDKITIYD